MNAFTLQPSLRSWCNDNLGEFDTRRLFVALDLLNHVPGATFITFKDLGDISESALRERKILGTIFAEVVGALCAERLQTPSCDDETIGSCMDALRLTAAQTAQIFGSESERVSGCEVALQLLGIWRDLDR